MGDRRELFNSLDAFLQRLIGLVESEGLNFLVDVEMSFTQVRTLMLLSCSDPLPIRSVADQLALSVHAAGRNIDQLVDLGFVERRESPDDRRVKLVSLSPHGREIIDAHLITRQRALRTFIDRLPDDQVAAFIAVLRSVLAGDYFHPRTSTEDHNDDKDQG